tara:strand:+ start:2158 stop:3399 length:1242 start_codon:yes stop_codon:yes gene_type:complete
MYRKNYSVHPSDKESFDLKIKPKIEQGEKLSIFCSFTFITPNYAILFTLDELRKFTDSGNHKIFLVIGDMNIRANDYFKKMSSSKKMEDSDSFLNDKVKELEILARSMGFKKEDLHIYRASDMWRRLIRYKDEDLFQNFYSVLAQMNVSEFSSIKRVSHLFQMPMDIFFCNYFHKLYPEDASKEMDLAFFGSNKEKPYLAARDLIAESGLIGSKKPIFILMKNFPYLIHNGNVPEFNMNLEDIKDIIKNCNLTKKELFEALGHLSDNHGDILVKEGKQASDLSFATFFKEYKDKDEKELVRILSENLHDYLQKRKKGFIEESGKLVEGILNVSDKAYVKQLGSVLKSSIALDILLNADGSKNLSEVSKEIGKSAQTISSYINKLKKMDLLRVLPNGKLKRNIKGVKVNLELGI